MGWIDEVPRTNGVYIGGLHALFQKQELFQELNITHILSVIDFDIYNGPGNSNNFKQFQTLQIRLEDDPNENLLQHFETTNHFIEEAITKPGKVFVHCAMGKSRSATIVCAYIMWKFGLLPSQALAQLCEGRPVCSPNPGFMEQLHLYHHMLNSPTPTKVYHDWLENRFQGDAWDWEKRGNPSAKL